jgi:hypothetical protein
MQQELVLQWREKYARLNMTVRLSVSGFPLEFSNVSGYWIAIGNKQAMHFG